MKYARVLVAFVSIAFFLLLSPNTFAQNLIQNPGFESTTSWVPSGSAGITAPEDWRYGIPIHSGYRSGFTNGVGSSSSLTQTLTPTPISDIANQAGSFSIWFYVSQVAGGFGSVSVTFTSATGNSLTYTMPQTTNQWVQFSSNFVNDWTAKGYTINDKIVKISLVAVGTPERCRYNRWADDVICSDETGQNVFWDDAQLKTQEVSVQQQPITNAPSTLSPPPSTVTIKVSDTKDTYVATGTKFFCWGTGCVCTDNYCSNNYGTAANIVLWTADHPTTGYVGFDNLASISQYLSSVTNAQLCVYVPNNIIGFYQCYSNVVTECHEVIHLVSVCSHTLVSNLCNINQLQIPVPVGAVSNNWQENTLTWAQYFNYGHGQLLQQGPAGQTINVNGQGYFCGDVTQGVNQNFVSWSLGPATLPSNVISMQSDVLVNSKENPADNAPYLQLTMPNIKQCTLVSANIVPHCSGFNGACQAGDTIEMDGSFLGDCSAANVFQIDASSSDGQCTLSYTGGLINGITSSSLTYNGAQVTGYWQIPSPLFTACIGKTINAKTASLWKGFPNSGTQISSATGSGTFPFVGPYYSISVSPATQQIAVGSQASYTITVQSHEGFSSIVSLSLSGWGTVRCSGRGVDRDCNQINDRYQFSQQQLSIPSNGQATSTLTLFGDSIGSYNNMQIVGTSGSLTINSNVFSAQVTPTCPVCQQATGWSACIINQQTRTNYKCDASTNYQCQAFTETQTCTPLCPTCQQPGAWSACIANQQSRTNYKCDASTNYQCQSFTETQACISPAQSATISLSSGWNLISFPVKQLTVNNVNCPSKDFVFYGWNSATQKWETVTNPSTLVTGRSYWILASQACQVSYSGTNSIQTSEVSLVGGWNAVGATDKTVNIANVKNNCNIVNAQAWDAASQSWVTATQLVPLNGYWIQVSSNCNFS